MTTTNKALADGFFPLTFTPNRVRNWALNVISREHPHSDDTVREAAQFLVWEIDRLRAMLERNGIDDGYEVGLPLTTFGP